ncbi:hypothetical protein, partial [Gracilibacillus thailandensis]
TIFPTPKPPATVPKTPKPWSVNYAMKWLKEQIPEVRIVQDSMGGTHIMFAKRSGEDVSRVGNGTKGTGNRLAGESDVKTLVGRGTVYKRKEKSIKA